MVDFFLEETLEEMLVVGSRTTVDSCLEFSARVESSGKMVSRTEAIPEDFWGGLVTSEVGWRVLTVTHLRFNLENS